MVSLLWAPASVAHGDPVGKLGAVPEKIPQGWMTARIIHILCRPWQRRGWLPGMLYMLPWETGIHWKNTRSFVGLARYSPDTTVCSNIYKFEPYKFTGPYIILALQHCQTYEKKRRHAVSHSINIHRHKFTPLYCHSILASSAQPQIDSLR